MGGLRSTISPNTCPEPGWNIFGKFLLDSFPAGRIIGIIERQLPNTMQMIRKHHNCVYLERLCRFRLAERLAQSIDMSYQQRLAFPCHRSKKITPTRYISTTIIAHTFPQPTSNICPKPVGWNRRALHKRFGLAWDFGRAVFHAIEIGPGAIRHAPPTRCPASPARSRNPLGIFSRGIRRGRGFVSSSGVVAHADSTLLRAYHRRAWKVAGAVSSKISSWMAAVRKPASRALSSTPRSQSTPARMAIRLLSLCSG
uniref:Uncharacterized protein n=1 Tax=Candidatus Kentrum sp. LFY TaxID=2126342 RepID=A0A450UCC3_9GAMM|nr:MAG: hypothetical protein BECKLFY1418B_GA0070995_10185 [Candidatus Kentron sp. LFY]